MRLTGLYAFWDRLLAENHGLQIDNCSSGGRRIDLEMIRRSVPLWRSDCNDVLGSQNHTAGFAPWVPLSGGVVLTEDIYQLRSAYCAGLLFEGGMSGPKNFPAEWLKNPHEEFAEVRPFFYGDYYPITPHSIFHPMSATLSPKSTLTARIHGCWLGKSIGGTLGLPAEGRMEQLGHGNTQKMSQGKLSAWPAMGPNFSSTASSS
jgi:hypothetical protein